MKEFLLDNYSVITKSVEFIAAISGTVYIKNNKNSVVKIFVYYLWITFFVEVIGEYGRLMRNNYDYDWFIAIKNSVFCENMWLYNIYSYVAIGFIGVFYSNLMLNIFYKNIIRGALVLFSLFTFIFFTVSDAFFLKSLPYDFILGTAVICLFVILYFIELMKSDEILNYYKLPSFYISIALLLWYLCVTPLFIFDGYFLEINAEFVIFKYLLLLIINICTYLCFAFGFWYSLYKRK